MRGMERRASIGFSSDESLATAFSELLTDSEANTPKSGKPETYLIKVSWLNWNDLFELLCIFSIKVVE